MTSATFQDTARLLDRLKRVYRMAGIRYADAAARIGVSEMTIKRAFAGRGLSMAMMEKLCAIADINLIELADLARQDAAPLPEMTRAQARAVVRDPLRFMTLFLLGHGWSIERIRQEFALDDIAMIRCVTELDRLRVIDLFPGNRVRLLHKMGGNVRAALSARRVSHFFRRLDLSDPANPWISGVARLSPASVTHMASRLEMLRREILGLMEADLNLPAEDVGWYVLFAAARPVPVRDLLSVAGPRDDESLLSVDTIS